MNQTEKIKMIYGFKISDAVNMMSGLDELFHTIHLALSPVIDTTIFFLKRNRTMLSNQNSKRRSIWLLPWVLLSVGLIATIVATIYVKMDVDADAKREFNFACSQIQLRIDARINAHEQILISAAALFDASDEVTREKWHAYTWRQNIEQHLPGIQGVGFSLVIPREEIQQHIQEIRSQGFPDYNVKPEGVRETYTSIIYLEPFSGRNLRAFGYDMFSEPVRRMAMERSRDLNMAVLSGKVILVQETDQDVQAGTLMYVPVYRKGMLTDTTEHRRDALYGWVYSPYRMKDMMQGILIGWALESEKRIRLQIFDNEQGSADSLLYDSQPMGKTETVDASRLTLQTHTDFNDHNWFLRFTQTDGQLNYGKVYGVFFAGTMISLLLFGLLISLLNTRFKAQQLADQLTVDIRESEEKYRIIFNNEIYAICIFDLETLKLLDVNDAYSRVYGYSREELISGMTIHDITAEHQVSEAATRKAIHDGTIFIPLRYHRKKDGTVFPVEIVGGPYVWKGQKVMFALAHDITDRKQAEEKIQELNRNFISFLENTSDFIYFKDENCRYRFCSQTLADITGHASWRDMIGKRSLDVFPVELAQIYYEEEIPVFRDGKPLLNKVDPYYDSLGKKGWVSTNKWPLLNHEGKVVGLFGISRDITDIKRTQEDLWKNKERLTLAMKATQDAIWDVDLTDNTPYYSPRWWQMLGYQENEMNPDIDLWRQLMHPEDLERVNRIIDDAIANETSFVAESRLFHKDGHYVPILSRGYILRDNDGKAIRVSGVNTDLTEQKKNDAERSRWERQRLQLEKAESLNRMAGAIAHHFNNQLYVVIGSLELVINDLPVGSDESQKLLNAMKASNRAADVSKLMLTYLGQTPGKPKLLDLSETCRKGLLMLQSVIPKNVLMAPPVFPLPGPTIRANMSQMHQILTNLVTNASESIADKKGTITLSVNTVSSADISLSHRFPIDWQPKEALYACLEVADTGSGITHVDIEKIFDPFFTTKFVGRGLGLAAVMGIVSAHGGGVTVESEIGRGSIFRVFLPVSAEAVSLSLEVEKATQIIESGTVLVIDDEPDVRQMVKAMLSHIGFTVLEATDGVEAMEIFTHQDNICCVLSDLSMPRMDGWDTLSALRNISPEIPVILSSGYDEAQVMTEEHSELPDAYLGKPYQLKDLRETINRVLTNKNRQNLTTNDIHILFVDDEPDILKAINRLISNENYREDYAPHFAGSGAEALSVMAKMPIHIIVTDLKMPEMDGLALLGQVKERYPDTVRMAMSAYLEIDQLLHCINTGEIFRYVTKPTKPEELKQAIRDAIDYFQAHKDRTDLVLELQEKNERLQEVLEQEW
jgi:PAS domain S-box-containing protein